MVQKIQYLKRVYFKLNDLLASDQSYWKLLAIIAIEPSQRKDLQMAIRL